MPPPFPTAIVPTRRVPVIWLALLLVLAIAAAFQNGIATPFLLDDEVSILDNESVHRLSLATLWPRRDVFTAGRPLLNLSFALNYAWGGVSPAGYHGTNMAIHALAALALFGVVRRTLLLPEAGHRALAAAAVPIAFGAALLWALHPLQTQSVTYLSQRAESLMGLCYLLTLYAFIRSTEQPTIGWRVIAVAGCLAGMLVKEVMVTAPLIVFLYDRAFIAGSFKEVWQRRRTLHLSLAATWLVLLLLMAGTRVQERGIGYEFGLAWHEYLRIECGAVLHYLRLALHPHPLIFDFGPQVSVPSPAQLAVFVLLLGGLLAATVVAWRRRPALGFPGVWFFLILAPTSSFVPVAGQPIAESRVYLPLAAVCAVGAAGTVLALGRRSRVPLCAIALGLGVITVARNREYRSELAIWADTVGKRPESARAHQYYGMALARANRVNEAARHFQTAVHLAPSNAYAHGGLGCALLAQNRLDDAIRHLETAARLKPNDPVIFNNLGTALFQAGRRLEAVRQYETALRVRPGHADSMVNLGIVLAHLGRTTEALALFEQTLRAYPGHRGAHDNLLQLRAALPSAPPR